MDKANKMINDFIVNDICWCMDSDRCKNKECFRHMSNMPTGGVFTASHLMWTNLCPLRRESEV